jgi:hypothetical protein
MIWRPAAVPWFDPDPAAPFRLGRTRFHRTTVAYGPGGSLLVSHEPLIVRRRQHKQLLVAIAGDVLGLGV